MKINGKSNLNKLNIMKTFLTYIILLIIVFISHTRFFTATASITLGSEANATANYAVAIGYQAHASAQDSFAFGRGVTNTVTNSSLFGGGVKVMGNISQEDDYYHCFGDACDAYMYFNGSSLVIKVT